MIHGCKIYFLFDECVHKVSLLSDAHLLFIFNSNLKCMEINNIFLNY